MKRIPSIVLAVCSLFGATAPPMAQSSTSYKLEESVFNAGGHPAADTVLASASFSVSIDAVGDALNGAGLGSASFAMDGGFLPAYAAPGEVLNLAFADAATLVWDPEFSAGSYSLYRGDLGTLSVSNAGACDQPGLPTPTATVVGAPDAVSGWFYLVAVENRLGEEGTRGTDSSDVLRPTTGVCP